MFDILPEWFAIISAGGAALGVIIKYIIKPLRSVDDAMEKISELDSSNKIILTSLLAIMNNLITGNNVDNLKQKRDELEKFCIDK